MGIPGFNVWFSHKHRGAYVTLNTLQVDHVYVDLNSILHNAVRTGGTWEKFHKRLHAKLNGLLEVTQPRKTVMLAVDGPAPLAKLLTQRSRRKRDKGGKSAKGSAKGDKKLSSNAITPGTLLMADITLSLAAWVAQKLETKRWQHLQFELSDGTVMGEGEVKILGRLARHWHALDPTDTHMIVGDDADLVLMACVSWRPHLYVANSAMTDEKHMHRDMKVFSVDALQRVWLQQLHASHTDLPLSDELKMLGMKMDLALMAVICSGNDYLPGLPGLKLEDMWHEYCKKRKQQVYVGLAICSLDTATKAPRINLANLVTVLKAAGTAVPVHHKQPTAVPDSNTGTLEDSTVPYDSLEADPAAYMKGLSWVMYTYLKGQCPDYRFTYDKVAPHPAQLAKWLLERAVHHRELVYTDWGPVPEAHRKPLPPVGCAVALLPSSSADLLPDALQPLMTEDNSSLAELFETCDECEEHKVACSIAMSQRAASQQRVQTLAAALSDARESGSELGLDTLQQQLAEAQADFEVRRVANITAVRAYEAHRAAAHPYKPFPIDRVAASVNSVDAQAMSATEAKLLSFGTPVVLGVAQGPRLQGGTRLPLPPQPFSNHKYEFVMRRHVVSMAIQEDVDADVAELVPDVQWAPTLADRYISNPPEVQLAPAARRAQAPAKTGQAARTGSAAQQWGSGPSRGSYREVDVTQIQRYEQGGAREQQASRRRDVEVSVAVGSSAGPGQSTWWQQQSVHAYSSGAEVTYQQQDMHIEAAGQQVTWEQQRIERVTPAGPSHNEQPTWQQQEARGSGDMLGTGQRGAGRAGRGRGRAAPQEAAGRGRGRQEGGGRGRGGRGQGRGSSVALEQAVGGEIERPSRLTGKRHASGSPAGQSSSASQPRTAAAAAATVYPPPQLVPGSMPAPPTIPPPPPRPRSSQPLQGVSSQATQMGMQPTMLQGPPVVSNTMMMRARGVPAGFRMP